MFKSIARDIKREFAYGNRITQLIIINTAVFVLLMLVKLLFTLLAGFQPSTNFDTIIPYLSLSSDLLFDFTHPWVFVTHMFLHVGFFHFLFNMLYLYWFGRIAGDLLGDKRMVPLYLLSGFAGALIYLITAPLISSIGGYALGASAAVMGIVVAAGAIAPDYILRLIFIGDVKLKYIVAILLFLDLVGIAFLSNTGGHMAHLGGAAFGYAYVSILRQGSDMTIPVNNLMNWFGSLFSTVPSARSGSKARRKLYVRARKKTSKGRSKSDTATEPDFQEKLDKILDKIKAAGYESLNAEEKEFLFQASKRQQ